MASLSQASGVRRSTRVAGAVAARWGDAVVSRIGALLRKSAELPEQREHVEVVVHLAREFAVEARPVAGVGRDAPVGRLDGAVRRLKRSGMGGFPAGLLGH